MNDRIKLAQAMGWKRTMEGGSIYPPVWYPPGLLPTANILGHELPDPENDANDDYAVLEFFRDSNTKAYRFGLELSKILHCSGVRYKIGDYYRTALMVLDD